MRLVEESPSPREARDGMGFGSEEDSAYMAGGETGNAKGLQTEE